MIPKLIRLTVILSCLSTINAAEGQLLSDDAKKRAAALIKNLSSDDFDVRESAAENLADMGEDVTALLKETMTATTDTDVKSRCENVLRKIRVESDPEAAAEAAGKRRDAKDFDEAAELYAKAQKLYKEQAIEAKDNHSRGEALDKEYTAKRNVQLMRAAERTGEVDESEIRIPREVIVQAIRRAEANFKRNDTQRSDKVAESDKPPSGSLHPDDDIDVLSDRPSFKPIPKK
jgi:hypothetical protein